MHGMELREHSSPVNCRTGLAECCEGRKTHNALFDREERRWVCVDSPAAASESDLLVDAVYHGQGQLPVLLLCPTGYLGGGAGQLSMVLCCVVLRWC